MLSLSRKHNSENSLTERSKKLVFVTITLGIIVYLIVIINKNNKDLLEFTVKESDIDTNHNTSIKIAILSKAKKNELDFLGQGRSAFLNNNCTNTNCYVDRPHLISKRLMDYDVLIFDYIHLPLTDYKILRRYRSSIHKFIFLMIESAPEYPICLHNFNSFFDYTWTYRIDSDIRWGYVTVFNKYGKKIGPLKNMTWQKSNEEVKNETINKLKSKSKAVAWFVSHCPTLGRRENYVKELKKELNKYEFTIDIFGKCGTLSCPEYEEKCEKMLLKDYLFYLSFENSFDEDYVTEKLLTAVDNYAVPIVYGGANYSRFLPPGSYLNARELGVEKLAYTINYLINNKTEYYKYFRWRNNYELASSAYNQNVCDLCDLLNDQKENKDSVYKDFIKWWNPEGFNCTDYITLFYNNFTPSAVSVELKKQKSAEPL